MNTAPHRARTKNTLEAMAGIARAPWVAPKELYALFDEAYPLPAPDGRRSAPFVPYLVYVPDDLLRRGTIRPHHIVEYSETGRVEPSLKPDVWYPDPDFSHGSRTSFPS